MWTWLMTLTFESNQDRAKINHHASYLGRRWFCLQVIVWRVDTQTDTHRQQSITMSSSVCLDCNFMNLLNQTTFDLDICYELKWLVVDWPLVGPGYPIPCLFPPLSIHFLIFCFVYFFPFPFLVRFTYFLLLSISSLFTRIVTKPFPGRRS